MSLPAPISSRRGRQAVDLAWEVTKLNCRSPITINAELIAAYQAASSPHSLRACQRHRGVRPLVPPKRARDLAGDSRDGRRLSRCPGRAGAKPASLGRYKASIAKIHQLLDIKDPTQAELVKLRLRAIRREKGSTQAQARPLRFKGPVRNVERDAPRGLMCGAA